MHISINTEEPLSDTDKAVLAVLSGSTVAAAAPAAAKPAAKTAAAKPAAKKAEAEPEADDEGADVDLKDEVTKTATKLVSGGKSAVVKEALTEIGVKKVSELSEDTYQQFLDLVNA